MSTTTKPLQKGIAAIIQKDDMFLVMHHDKSGTVSLPTGKIDEGEDCFMTVKREMKEELGLTIDVAHWLGNRDIEYMEVIGKMDFIRLETIGQWTNAEPHKHKWVAFMTFEQILDLDVPMSPELEYFWQNKERMMDI